MGDIDSAGYMDSIGNIHLQENIIWHKELSVTSGFDHKSPHYSAPRLDLTPNLVPRTG
jgi:hypothetical protein